MTGAIDGANGGHKDLRHTTNSNDRRDAASQTDGRQQQASTTGVNHGRQRQASTTGANVRRQRQAPSIGSVPPFVRDRARAAACVRHLGRFGAAWRGNTP
ncbi:hypothetical protein GCM10010460_13940 [Microbacterium terrae]|nr:hypothetical protein GCM10017594_15300 [Microbacterium terrae]